MNIKLIITDIDGTLIGDSQEVDDRTKRAVRLAQQNGIAIAAATGRMLPAAIRYVRELDIHGALICYNGALIVNSMTDEVIYERTISMDLAAEVLEFAQCEGIYAQYYDKRVYYMRNHSPESESYFMHTGVKGEAVGSNLANELGCEPLKILLISDSVKRADDIFDKAVEKFKGRLEIVKSMSMFIDFTHPEANKGLAGRILAKRMGIGMENVMAIGDGLNDVSMLRQAGFGVAIGDAHQSVKDAADYVTSSQQNFGAAKAIEKFVLKER